MIFGQAWVLFLGWMIPFLAFFWWQLRRSRVRRLEHLIDPALRSKICPPSQPWRFRVQLSMVTAGLLLALLAAAMPRWGYREEKVLQRGRDLVIALDVSRSMLAQDVQPNRLERAKADTLDLLRVLHGDRVGLLAFRGRAVLLCPLTTDYNFLEMILSEVTIDSAPPGSTDLAEAIEKARESFADDAGAHRAVVLISDGEDLAGRALEAAQEAAKAGIVIFTVGLGDAAGAPIPDSRMPGGQMLYKGEQVLTKLESTTLEKIANLTGGAYVPVGLSNVKLDSLYRNHLRAIAARDLAEKSQRGLVERYQWFLAPALFLFLLMTLFSQGRPAKQALVKPQKIVLWLLLLSLPCRPLCAESSAPHKTISPRDQALQAWRLYQTGKYHEAAETWLRSAGVTVQSNNVIYNASADFEREEGLRHKMLFNAACALYRSGSHRAAAALFAELATRDTVFKNDTMYNQGCAWWQAAAESEDAAERIACLEKAELAFRQAAQSRATSATAALEAVAEALTKEREAERLAKLMEKYSGRTPDVIADEVLREQRAVGEGVKKYSSASPPVRVEQMDKLAERQGIVADILHPLQLALEEAVSQGAEGATTNMALPQIGMYFDALSEIMHQSRTRLRELDPRAGETAEVAAHGVYKLWKEIVPFPAVLLEGIRCQSNAWVLAESKADLSEPAAIREEQVETQILTELFLERFTAAVPEEGFSLPEGQMSDAGQLITPEQRSQIITLAQQAVAKQKEALAALERSERDELLAAQQTSHELLLAILELLPPPPPEPQSDQSEENQTDQQEQQSADNSQTEKNSESSDQDDSSSQEEQTEANSEEESGTDSETEQPEEGEQPQEEPAEQADSEDVDEQEQAEKDAAQAEEEEAEKEETELEQAEEKDEMTPEQAQLLLMRAAEREKEYRLRQQRQYSPPSPADRDW